MAQGLWCGYVRGETAYRMDVLLVLWKLVFNL